MEEMVVDPSRSSEVDKVETEERWSENSKLNSEILNQEGKYSRPETCFRIKRKLVRFDLQSLVSAAWSRFEQLYICKAPKNTLHNVTVSK